ncbi:unnamed protein product, partial [Scytosiphon promiscuus]
GGGDAEEAREDVFVFGDVVRLEAEIFAATGIEGALSVDRTAGLKGVKGVDPAARVSSVLRGVPWLTFVGDESDGVEGGGLLVWRPPPVVAEALDRDAHPTAWLSSFASSVAEGGVRYRGGVEDVGSSCSSDGVGSIGVSGVDGSGGGGARNGGESGDPQGIQRARQQQQQHPCMQQFLAYLAHRDDIDLAAALARAGYFCSSSLVAGRVIAAAALPEELGSTSAVGVRREGQLPALRAGGAPPSWTALEEEACGRPATWSNPALVRRFEELAGFRLVGTDGRLSLGGVPRRTFDEIAETVPGLQTSAMGGHAMSRRVFRAAKKLAEEKERARTGETAAAG